MNNFIFYKKFKYYCLPYYVYFKSHYSNKNISFYIAGKNMWVIFILNLQFIFIKANKYYFIKLINKQQLNMKSLNTIVQNIIKLPGFYYKLILIGLGYKYFIYKNCLYILIGFSHYILFPLNLLHIYIKCKKKKIFLFSKNKQNLLSFISKFKNFRPVNIYKGKGIIEFKNFKPFVKLKKGKKQYKSI